MTEYRRILMVAAENDALPGAKVGGVGDVIRDLPRALVHKGMCVDTAIPSYGFLSRMAHLEHVGMITIKFASQLHDINIFKRRGENDGSHHYIFDHPEFSKQGETVYNDDGGDRPFASDSTKFAFFSTCVAQAMMQGIVPRPDIIHCHDWHAAYLLILIQFGYEYVALRNIKTVYTIHNLAMQGIRPFHGDESSFRKWFPDLRYSVDKLTDPRYTDCVNPMRAGILLADKVHTVSPSYAHEILHASNYGLGIYGGDGLENDLRERTDRGDVSGILNGCEYPEDLDRTVLSKAKMGKLMLASIKRWAARSPYLRSAHWFAEKSVTRWQAKKKDSIVITSVGRLTEQKVRVLLTQVEDGKTALQALLDELGDQGSIIMLGSGDPELEMQISEISALNDNLIFLNGYSDELSKALYNYGDLFLMPSSFEPCGISQMLAMRVGQPCIVNAVGGLKDTVQHYETGFSFYGQNVFEHARGLVGLFKEVINVHKNDKETWKRISQSAEQVRFTWDHAAQEYLEKLYW